MHGCGCGCGGRGVEEGRVMVKMVRVWEREGRFSRHQRLSPTKDCQPYKLSPTKDCRPYKIVRPYKVVAHTNWSPTQIGRPPKVVAHIKSVAHQESSPIHIGRPHKIRRPPKIVAHQRLPRGALVYGSYFITLRCAFTMNDFRMGLPSDLPTITLLVAVAWILINDDCRV